jgi:hypothetical protein
MEADLFHQFMLQIRAVKHVTHVSPFAMYLIEERKIIFQFIDYNTYKNQQLPDDFFVDLSRKTSTINHQVINIWEDVWMHKTDLVKARILSIIGQAQKIHARQTKVVRIDKQQAQFFLSQNHLQGVTSAYYKFGLIFKEELVAVATFSKARIMYDGPVYYRSYELERFASKAGTNVVGGLSKLMKHFIKINHAQHIMTYADRDWSSGESYLKIGFNWVEETVPQLFYIDELNQSRLAENQITNSQNKIRIHNAGSIKFVYDNR